MREHLKRHLPTHKGPQASKGIVQGEGCKKSDHDWRILLISTIGIRLILGIYVYYTIYIYTQLEQLCLKKAQLYNLNILISKK